MYAKSDSHLMELYGIADIKSCRSKLSSSAALASPTVKSHRNPFAMITRSEDQLNQTRGLPDISCGYSQNSEEKNAPVSNNFGLLEKVKNLNEEKEKKCK